MGPRQGARWLLLIAVNHCRYHGWQAQGNAISVQSVISETLSAVLGRETTVYASGRTDQGVHALRQGCHFDTSSSIDPGKFALILNTKLPKSIRVLSSSEAPAGFHARFSTMSREYWYLIKSAQDMLPFDDKRITPIKRLPGLDLLNDYASCIQGTHDFTTFASARDPSPSKFRDVYISEWDAINDLYGYPVLRYRVAGNAFLYHQVRSMVGTMVGAALLGEDPSSFRDRLEGRDRSLALKTAAPDGLYLADVSYDEEKYRWFEDRYAGQC